MSRRSALIALALAALLFVAQALLWRRVAAPRAPATHVAAPWGAGSAAAGAAGGWGGGVGTSGASGVGLLASPGLAPDALGPAESAAHLALGGFRPLVVAALWVELLDRREQGDVFAIPPLADLIVRLDPRLEAAWSVTAWTIAVDLAGFDERAEVEWPWLRQGLLHLARGLRANPASPHLRYELGLLAFARAARDPALAARFLADAEVNPTGIDPVRFARMAWTDAQAIDPHPVAIDWGVIRAALAEAYALSSTGRAGEARVMLDEADRTLAHVRAAHPEATRPAIDAAAERIALARAALAPR